MIPAISIAQPASLPTVSALPSSLDGKTKEVAKKKLSGAQKRHRCKQNRAAEKEFMSTAATHLKETTPEQMVEWIKQVQSMTVEERKKYQNETASFLVKETKISPAFAQQKAKTSIEQMHAADFSSEEASLRSFAQVYQQMSEEEKLGQQEVLMGLWKNDGCTEVEAARKYTDMVKQALSLSAKQVNILLNKNRVAVKVSGTIK